MPESERPPGCKHLLFPRCGCTITPGVKPRGVRGRKPAAAPEPLPQLSDEDAEVRHYTRLIPHPPGYSCRPKTVTSMQRYVEGQKLVMREMKARGEWPPQDPASLTATSSPRTSEPDRAAIAPIAPLPGAPAPEPAMPAEDPKEVAKRRFSHRSPARLRAEASYAERVASQKLADIVSQEIASGDPERIRGILGTFEAALALISFSEFCRQAWPTVEPSTRLEWGRHHELICTVMQALFHEWRKGKRDPSYIPEVVNTIINCPPGSLKSRLIAVFFNAWVWLHEPGTKFICISVNEKAAHRDARATRDLVRSDWYRGILVTTDSQGGVPWELKGDQDAVSDYGNTASGGRLSQASGSEIVGLRGDWLLVDDANSPDASENEAERTKVNDLWDMNTYTRVNDPLRSMRIGVQQRTHALDWTGHVIDRQGTWSAENKTGWMHVVLPAEFDPRRAFALPEVLAAHVRAVPGAELRDWREEHGEVLHPARMTPEWIQKEKDRWRGTNGYACQMDQLPAAAGGGRIKLANFGWFRLAKGVHDLVDELGAGHPRPFGCDEKKKAITIGAAVHRPGCWDFDMVEITVDPAAKKTARGSNYGLLAMARKGGRRFVLQDRTTKGEVDEILLIIKEMVRMWRPDRILIEQKAAGPPLTRALELAMADGSVPAVAVEKIEPGTADKEMRMDGAIPTIAAGLVHLLEGAEWLEEFCAELGAFPNYKTDDRADALSQAINHEAVGGDGGLPDW